LALPLYDTPVSTPGSPATVKTLHIYFRASIIKLPRNWFSALLLYGNYFSGFAVQIRASFFKLSMG
jgi:hypothetical protein